MTTVKATTNTDPLARLAAAEAAISEVDNYEQEQRQAAEQRRQRKAQAIATKKAVLPDVLRGDIAREKDTLAAILDTNRSAAQDAQAKLQTAAANLDKALADVRNALAEVERTYAQHDHQAHQIWSVAYRGYQEIVELDRPDFVQNFGETRAQMEIERVINSQHGTFVGALPAATSPIMVMLLAIQATKSTAQRRLLQGLVWALSGAPNGSTPDPASDFQPPAHHQRQRG